MTWRTATRDEIFEYYNNEFPTDESAFPSFISASGPKQYALAFDRDHPVQASGAPDRDFIRRDTRTGANPDTGERGSPVFSTFSELVEFIRAPAENDPLQNQDTNSALIEPELADAAPAPEAVYYGVDHWERNWLLVFDIDAKDIAERKVQAALANGDLTRGEGEDTLEAGNIREQPPQGKPYRFSHIEDALEQGFMLADELETTFNFDETMVVYSGQGCHIYGLDNGRKHNYDEKSRELFNYYIQGMQNLDIDTVVTADKARVMRLPYSLHAGVSRIVTPIESPDFDFRNEAKPAFLEDANPSSSIGGEKA